MRLKKNPPIINFIANQLDLSEKISLGVLAKKLSQVQKTVLEFSTRPIRCMF